MKKIKWWSALIVSILVLAYINTIYEANATKSAVMQLADSDIVYSAGRVLSGRTLISAVSIISFLLIGVSIINIFSKGEKDEKN